MQIYSMRQRPLARVIVNPHLDATAADHQNKKRLTSIMEQMNSSITIENFVAFCEIYLRVPSFTFENQTQSNLKMVSNNRLLLKLQKIGTTSDILTPICYLKGREACSQHVRPRDASGQNYVVHHSFNTPNSTRPFEERVCAMD